MGYAVEWSPFDETKLAVSSAQNFGIIGKGKQYVLNVKGGVVNEIASFETNDGTYSCSWSESVASHLAFACGDGTIYIWDYITNKTLRLWHEHTQEIYTVDWNLVNKENIITGAWDNTLKLWHPDHARSLRTFKEHTQCIYSAVWHPKNPEMFASTSGDCTLKVWDCNSPKSSMTIKAHNYEVLTCDWNKYNEFLVVTGSVDKSVRVWDIRKGGSGPVRALNGHEFAVRYVKCSPHNPRTLASCSYDMTMKVWDTEAEDAIVRTYDHHTEFVLGVDFNLFIENYLATVSWDQTVTCFNITDKNQPPNPYSNSDKVVTPTKQ